MVHEHTELNLPVTVATRIDVGRLLRELDNINEALLQLRLRAPGTEMKMPKTTHMMDKLTELNQLNLLKEADRIRLKAFLQDIKANAPVVHASFSADPSVTFMEKLVAWLRREIHPSLLVTVGLQPILGAGCVLRTTNKHFDLSLREDFKKKRDLLKQALRPAVEEAKA